MLRLALREVGGEALCREVGIDPNARAETVPVGRFLALAKLSLAATGTATALDKRSNMSEKDRI